MERYSNRSKQSGVTGYTLGKDFIIIRFADGEVYTYTYKMPGRRHVENMKKLARAGKGLATYINKYVRGNFAGKGKFSNEERVW